jgi:hypothetical protein
VDVDDVGDLVEVEGRVLGLEVHDESANPRRKHLAPGPLRSEQALHPVALETLHPTIQGSLGGPGLFGPLKDRVSEQDQGADLLVALLLRPFHQ